MLMSSPAHMNNLCTDKMRCGLVLGVCVAAVWRGLSVRGQGCAVVSPCLSYSYVPCSTSEQILINSSNTSEKWCMI